MWDVRLMGAVEIIDRRSHRSRPLPARAMSLLAYLLLHRERPPTRATVAAEFWGDLPDEVARRRLTTALWRLRRILAPELFPVTRSDRIAVDVEGRMRLDVADFEIPTARILRRPMEMMTADDTEALAAALRAYGGELLTGCYENWAVVERERLAELRRAVLHRMVHRYAQDMPETALHHARVLLADDPLREDVHRVVMRLYAATGRRADALRQFARCRAVLAAELGVDPLPETTALAARIEFGAPVDRDTAVGPLVIASSTPRPRTPSAPSAPSGPPIPEHRGPVPDLLERMMRAQREIAALTPLLADAVRALQEVHDGGGRPDLAPRRP